MKEQRTEQKISTLIEQIKFDEAWWNYEDRWEAGLELARLGPIAFPAVVELLSDEEFYVKCIAAFTLGELGDRRAVDPLLRALTDEDDEVHIHAVKALGKLGDKRAVEPLIRTLDHPDINVRRFSALALASLQDTWAIGPLIQHFQQEQHFHPKAGMAKALGALGAQNAIDVLIEALDDPDPDVRFYSIGALAALGAERALPKLQALQAHDNGKTRFRKESVAEAARQAVQQIGQQ